MLTLFEKISILWRCWKGEGFPRRLIFKILAKNFLFCSVPRIFESFFLRSALWNLKTHKRSSHRAIEGKRDWGINEWLIGDAFASVAHLNLQLSWLNSQRKLCAQLETIQRWEFLSNVLSDFFPREPYRKLRSESPQKQCKISIFVPVQQLSGGIWT